MIDLSKETIEKLTQEAIKKETEKVNELRRKKQYIPSLCKIGIQK